MGDYATAKQARLAISGSSAVVFDPQTGDALSLAGATIPDPYTPPDGTFTITGGVAVSGSATVAGSLNYNAPTSAKTTAFPVTTALAGTVFTNTGAGGQVIFTLPTASASAGPWTFVVTAAQNVRVKCAAGDKLQVGTAILGADGGHIDCATVGGSVTVVGTAANRFQVVAMVGTWTVD